VIDNQMRVFALCTGFAIIGFVQPAIAAQFDGPDYPIQLVGRVTAGGQVRMNAVAGPRSTQGTGRFNRFRGSGTWAGIGPFGVCSGIWGAVRP